MSGQRESDDTLPLECLQGPKHRPAVVDFGHIDGDCYYADQLSIRSETRGNSTVRVKNESRGFHLNNLSYAGPIVMGIGGFIVVAACVMTFEARDSAAKVVPARFKANLNSSIRDRESTMPSHSSSKCLQRLESKRTASSQTGGSSGVYKLDSCKTESEWSPKCEPTGRNALTAAFAQLSLELLENSSFNESRQWPRRKFSEVKLNKSPSAPDLASENTPVQNNGVLVEMIDRLSPDFASKLPNKLAQLEIPHHLVSSAFVKVCNCEAERKR
ncbi:hypothetical protein RUM44_003001 [Polyplax serrata]|uniref:Uncharacterized protein n=1 Tax=Polyplax serrata TaxID=468196 RepID=A0ABR1AXD9_POLSC